MGIKALGDINLYSVAGPGKSLFPCRGSVCKFLWFQDLTGKPV